MKHLYIIGNGFDIFTGLRTQYSEFRKWLEVHYPFIYENMVETYDMEGDWWNNFEEQLGSLDVKRFVKKFSKPDASMVQIIEKLGKSKEPNNRQEGFANILPVLTETPCANRLRGLLDVLQYCFEKWVADCQSVIKDYKLIDIETEDSYFINFNYTDVLQWLYKISDERVFHIHGQASKHERLIFGHNKYPHGGVCGSKDVDKTCFELYRFHKNPYEYIFRKNDLSEKLSDVKYIHVYGFSISPVDEDYLDWIERNTPENCHWEFSWYTEIDQIRINKFVLDHWRINGRHNLMQLEAQNYEVL